MEHMNLHGDFVYYDWLTVMTVLSVMLSIIGLLYGLSVLMQSLPRD